MGSETSWAKWERESREPDIIGMHGGGGRGQNWVTWSKCGRHMGMLAGITITVWSRIHSVTCDQTSSAPTDASI